MPFTSPARDSCIGHLHLLWQIAHRNVPAAGDCPFAGRCSAREDFENVVFPAPFLAYKANAVARVYKEGYIFEKVPAAEANC